MRKLVLTALVAIAGLAATPVTACRIWTPSASLSVIHRTLPTPLPSGALAFDVQFAAEDRGWEVLRRGARVRVRRVIQGHYTGGTVIVRDLGDANGIRIICYEPIRYDGAGVIIGIPTGYENGILVLQPIFEPHDPRR